MPKNEALSHFPTDLPRTIPVRPREDQFFDPEELSDEQREALRREANFTLEERTRRTIARLRSFIGSW